MNNMKTLRQFRDRRRENGKMLKHSVAQKALKLCVEPPHSANTVFKKAAYYEHTKLGL